MGNRLGEHAGTTRVEEAIRAVTQSQQSSPSTGFGPNEWLVDEIYHQYLRDPESVDKAWWDFFEDYQPADSGSQRQRRLGAGQRGTVNAGPAPATPPTASAPAAAPTPQ